MINDVLKCDYIFRAGVKGLLVLMPILGVTWLLGLFYVDRNTLFFQYAFAICNAFQVRANKIWRRLNYSVIGVNYQPQGRFER